MANKSGFRFDAFNLEKGLKLFENKSKAAIEMKIATKYAPQLQSNAQLNARWENRTGEARRRLNCDYETVSNGYKLILVHGVNYGIWLELAHEKRYAIIMETIEYVGTFEIIPDFEKFIEKLSKGI